MKTLLTFVHALSPLHAGIGQGAGVIDMPIARETATGIPFLPGSSLKGTLRTRCTNEKGKDDRCRDIFGSDPDDNLESTNRASSVLITDQRLLLLPVRSIAGTFAWITSPFVLYRFLREAAETGIRDIPDAAFITNQSTQLKENSCLVTKKSKLFIKKQDENEQDKPGDIYLEDLDLSGTSSTGAQTWSEWLGRQLFPEDSIWQTLLSERFCIVPDDIFTFLSEQSTEVQARIRLEAESKTAIDGGLWYEETLPGESILSGLMVVLPAKEVQSRMNTRAIIETVQELATGTLQLGGKATTGRGLCRVRLIEGKE